MPHDRTAPKAKITQTMERFPPDLALAALAPAVLVDCISSPDSITAIRQLDVAYYLENVALPLHDPTHRYSVADLLDCGDRIRFRFVCAADASTDPAAGN